METEATELPLSHNKIFVFTVEVLRKLILISFRLEKEGVDIAFEGCLLKSLHNLTKWIWQLCSVFC